MLHLIADLAGTSDYVSGGTVVVITALVGWVLKSALPALAKQYRDDVFTMQDKHDRAVNVILDRHEKDMDRLLASALEERKENRVNLEKELLKRDSTIDKVTEVLKEIVNNVRILSDEVRTLKQLIPMATLLESKLKEKLEK